MKKQLKKTLSLILSLMMIISMFAGLDIISFADNDVLNYLYYEVSNGEAIITDCDSSISGEVIIPDIIYGFDAVESYKVTAIGDYAFSYCSQIEKISIPASVTTISINAFDECDSLVSITVDKNNKNYSSDEYGVLYNKNKTELLQYPEGNGSTEYVVPDGVTIIGESAFYSCDNLVNVVISDSVTTICSYAFYWSSCLENVHIGKNVTTIGDFAFNSCNVFKSIIIPESVTSIGENVFSAGFESECDWFVIYGTPGSAAENYAKENSIITFVDITIFPSDPLLNEGLAYVDWKIDNEQVVITRCDKSFSGDLIIPSKINGYPVTTINNSAFYECKNLTGIILPDSLITIGDNAFESCKNLKTITIPDTVKTIGIGAFSFCSGLTSVIIGNGVTVINDNAFKGCSHLENIIIGKNVKTIGKSAFANCSNLKSISIPDNVTSIGREAFEGCRSLESVIIGNGITIIEGEVFAWCGHLSNITIPDSVTTISSYAFSYCDSIKTIIIPESVTTIGNNAFYYCTGLESVVIGNGVTTIGDNAFDSCPALESVTIPASVTSIGKCAFGYGEGTVLYGSLEIHGIPGTEAEVYANANKIPFISVLPEEPPVEEPPVEEPPVEEPPVEEPPVEEPPVEEPPVEEPPVEEPPVEEPPVEEPPVEEPPVEEPADNGQLEVKGEGGITTDFENKISQIAKEQTVETLSEMIENENFAIVDKNGNAIADNAFVGTGSKIQILADDGSVLNEYTIIVPTDIDGNGKTTAADARLALRTSAQLESLDGVYFEAADITGDGKITASDARKILRIAANLEK